MNIWTKARTSVPCIAALRAGFSLIELMIVVAIVAVLAAIAIPSYTNYVVRGNMSEGLILLSNTAQALERCYSRTSTYENCLTLPIASENNWYQITEESSDFNATTFTIGAVPQGVQATRETSCGTFTLNERGQRGASLASDQDGIRECWRGR